MAHILKNIVVLFLFGALLTFLTAPVLEPLLGDIIAGEGYESFIDSIYAGWDESIANPFSLWSNYYLSASITSEIPTIGLLLVFWLCVIGVGAFLICFKNPNREIKNGLFGRQRSERRHRKILKRCWSWDGMPNKSQSGGFVVGYLHGRYVISPATHFLAVAPSGSYKTRGSVLPSIAYLSQSGTKSIVITDPSMELFCFSEPMLADRGYTINLIDLDNPYRAQRINFLRPLIALHEQGLDYLVEERANEIGALLFPEKGDDDSAFVIPASGLVAAVCLIFATSDEIPDNCRHLYSVIQTILDGTTNGTAPLKNWLKSLNNSTVTGMAAAFLSSEGKYEASILGVLFNGLRPFNTTAMRYLISGEDINYEGILKQPSVLFLHTLNPDLPANKLVSLTLSQLWDATVREGQRRGSITDCYYLLDEAASIPKFPLPTILQQGRKYGVHIALYLQSISGLDTYKSAHRNGKDEILSNCDSQAIFRAGSQEDARYFEAISGTGTFLGKNISETKNSRNPSTNVGYSEREKKIWLQGDLIQRDPMKDGILLFQNPTGNSKSMGKFEVPITEITEVGFMIDQFKTIGNRQFEQTVICDTLDELDNIAAKQRKEQPDPIYWSPDFEALDNSPPDNNHGDEDLFGV